jgi:hypothetical protein
MTDARDPRYLSVPVPGDGDCFFYAVLVSVGLLGPGKTLWEASAKKMAQDLRRALYLDSYVNVERFGFSHSQLRDVRHRLASNDWAQREEVQMVATIFDLQICVKTTYVATSVWDVVSPDTLFSEDAARACGRAPCQDHRGTRILLECLHDHYTALLWKSPLCVHKLRKNFKATFQGLLEKHKLKVPDRPSVCAETLKSVEGSYAAAKRIAGLYWSSDVLAHLLDLRHSTLSTIRRACQQLQLQYPDFRCEGLLLDRPQSLRNALRALCGALDALFAKSPWKTSDPTVMRTMERLVAHRDKFDYFTEFLEGAA